MKRTYITGTVYHASQSDAGNVVVLTNDEAKVALFDRDPAGHPDGHWHFENAGQGSLWIVAANGVTITPDDGATLALQQGEGATVARVGVDTYRLLAGLSA